MNDKHLYVWFAIVLLVGVVALWTQTLVIN